MKIILNKKAFTLTEILVVIALISILLMLIMPALTKVFNSSIENTMKIEEKEVKDAALLYLEDHCKSKINNNSCPPTIIRNQDYSYSGHITLEELKNKKYIEEVMLRKEKCIGCVIYTNDKAKSYLQCGETYQTNTSVDWKTICEIN